jgi:hypothetical protein
MRRTTLRIALGALLALALRDAAHAQPFRVELFSGFEHVSDSVGVVRPVLPAIPPAPRWPDFRLRPVGASPESVFAALNGAGLVGWLRAVTPDAPGLVFRADTLAAHVLIRANVPFAWQDLIPDSVRVRLQRDSDSQFQGRNANTVAAEIGTTAKLVLVERATTRPVRLDLSLPPFGFRQSGSVQQLVQPSIQTRGGFTHAVPVRVEWAGGQIHAWQGQRLTLTHAGGSSTDILVLVSEMTPPTVRNAEHAPFQLQLLLLTHQ